MKKMSWGTGITIVIVLFLIVTIGQAIAIHVFIDYDLVVEEYYEADLKYQTQIDKVERTNALSDRLKIKLINQFIEFDFPSIFEDKAISGFIHFYKPSNDLLDKTQAVKLNEDNKMFFATNELKTGLWKVKVNWEVNGIEYYNEKLLMVP
ncbi:MAG: FixH family protein [Melioribacteraceae bacterium]|nr:FixH family protein [Melioribacteraceae bacterium]